MRYFISAIGTDSGKTVAAAILVEALKADYWKPIQAGIPTDSNTIRQLVSPGTVIHPEQFLLKTPASPHAAAAIDDIHINISDIEAPYTKNTLVIEGAGGLLVPVNNQEMVADMIPHLRAELILVCNIYLGSINHSLLSLELIKARGYPLRGIIFNGPKTPATEHIIQKNSPAPCLLHIEQEETMSRKLISIYAQELKLNMHELD